MSLCTLDIQDNIATITLDDGRGNAIDARLLESFSSALSDAEQCGSLILRGREKVFSGGLNLPSLVELGRDEMSAFLETFDRFHTQLLSFPVPIITVARGSAVAGGAILFASGDHRLASPAGKVGVNEAALGLNIPTSALEILRIALGERGVALATCSARLYEGDERLSSGFATEILPAESLDARALELAKQYAQNDRQALALLRRDLRASSLERVERDGARARAAFLERWFTNETRERLQVLVMRLQGR